MFGSSSSSSQKSHQSGNPFDDPFASVSPPQTYSNPFDVNPFATPAYSNPAPAPRSVDFRDPFSSFVPTQQPQSGNIMGMYTSPGPKTKPPASFDPFADLG